ncbi:MAG: type II secretion system protein, partial [Candidatus Gastranaerophilaceae bacterium]
GENLKLLSHSEGFCPKESSLCLNQKAGLPRRFASRNDRLAFTLSEVLITLGIIGVVAALTLPTVINDTKNKEYAGARKKVLATVGEAGRLLAVQGNIRSAENAKDFVENYLNRQLRIIKTCENDNLRDCGIETGENKIISLDEKKITMPTKIGDLAIGISSGGSTDADSTSYGFVMSNGYSVNLFYNPNCMSDNKDTHHWGQDRVCVNAIYDMNGLSQPNEVGKDIGFVTIIYPDIQSVAYAPDVYKQNALPATFDNASESCQALGNDLSVPDRDELLSVYYNMNLLGIPGGNYWSASGATTELGWAQNFLNGRRARDNISLSYNVRCVWR